MYSAMLVSWTVEYRVLLTTSFLMQACGAYAYRSSSASRFTQWRYTYHYIYHCYRRFLGSIPHEQILDFGRTIVESLQRAVS